jgi:hypothetical protein
MAKPKPKVLTEAAQRVTRAHFLFIAAYILAVIIFDSWNLIARDAIGRRWLAAGVLLAVNTIAWYLAHNQLKRESSYRLIILALVLSDIIFAGLNVYWERGMAATNVILFAVPLATIAVLRSRVALVAAATLCSAAYATAAVKYFFDYYGEGYRVQLYGQIVFFGLVFYALAWLLLVTADTAEAKRR